MTLIKVKSRGTDNVSGRRNIMYNGAMQIAQRGDQTSLTNGYTGCDRWKFDRSGSSAVVTGKQTSSGNIPENGFPNAVHIDVTTADSSVSAGDLVLLRQYIESQDLQHLKFGTSSAESLTLSFWVKSSKTGTHWVEIYAYDANKVNSASYSVSSANTWEHKTVTFVGETSTAIPNDNTHGIVVQWWLKAGSTYAGGTHPGNVWHLTNANRVPGQVNVMDSTDNNFYLTGVQLEVGDSASDFEHRSVAEEFALCQRYYIDIANSVDATFGIGSLYTASVVYGSLNFPHQMRANPTLIMTTGTNYYLFYTNGSSDPFNSVTLAYSSPEAIEFYNQTEISSTAGHSGFFRIGNASAKLALDAEL